MSHTSKNINNFNSCPLYITVRFCSVLNWWRRADRKMGLRSVPKSLICVLHHPITALSPPSLLPVQWVGGELWHPGARPRRLDRQTGLRSRLRPSDRQQLLPPLPGRLSSRLRPAEHGLPPLEHGLPPAQRLDVTALDPVVALSLPLQLLQACTHKQEVAVRTMASAAAEG